MSLLLSKLWAFIAPYMPDIMGYVKQLALFIAGKEWQKKIDECDQSQKLSEQYKSIIAVEQENSSRPVAGSADRLRRSKLSGD